MFWLYPGRMHRLARRLISQTIRGTVPENSPPKQASPDL